MPIVKDGYSPKELRTANGGMKVLVGLQTEQVVKVRKADPKVRSK